VTCNLLPTASRRNGAWLRPGPKNGLRDERPACNKKLRAHRVGRFGSFDVWDAQGRRNAIGVDEIKPLFLRKSQKTWFCLLRWDRQERPGWECSPGCRDKLAVRKTSLARGTIRSPLDQKPRRFWDRPRNRPLVPRNDRPNLFRPFSFCERATMRSMSGTRPACFTRPILSPERIASKHPTQLGPVFDLRRGRPVRKGSAERAWFTRSESMRRGRVVLIVPPCSILLRGSSRISRF